MQLGSPGCKIGSTRYLLGSLARLYVTKLLESYQKFTGARKKFTGVLKQFTGAGIVARNSLGFLVDPVGVIFQWQIIHGWGTPVHPDAPRCT